MTLEELKADLPPGSYAYLASPYSLFPEGLQAAFTRVCVVAGKLMRRGIPLFSPIAHSHAISHVAGLDPFDYELWMPADQPLMDGAALMLIADLDGWDLSWGVGFEITQFLLADKAIYLVDSDTLELTPLER